nr:hypothetical protein [Tanacetum cinerariifolium]
MLLMQAQKNRVALDEEQLLFIVADDCDAFDSDVDEAPTAQNMFMANLSSADLVSDEAVHEMHGDVQLNYIVDSYTDDTSNSNMILYDPYVKDNAMPVVQSNVSTVPNDAYMMILNDMHEPPAQHVSVTPQNKVVDKSLTAELETYKEQVELYERRSRFELTEREQKIDEQLRIVITDRNIKEENLKKELHSRKVAISYKSPLCLSRAKQVQPALYNGHEIIKTDHVPAIVHNSEDTLEIAKITRKKINEKMKTPLWTHNKINIRPPNYSIENFLATFAPQTQLTPKQIFWSKYVFKMKTNALKEQAKAVKALTVYPPNTPVKLVPRALTTEIKEVKAIFDELEAEVDQNVVNRKYDEIKRKNLLIANDTLIVNCLSKEVFYIATNSELNVSRFSEMHDV